VADAGLLRPERTTGIRRMCSLRSLSTLNGFALETDVVPST
jgi:hypothetical protein